MRFLLLLMLAACTAYGQDKAAATDAKPEAPVKPELKASEQETLALTLALREAGESPRDYIRVLEAHLARFPNSARRPEIEVALAKSAVDAKDDARIILYGERVVARDSSDIQLMDRIARAYLDTETPASAEKAMAWAEKFYVAVGDLRKKPPPAHTTAGQWSDELDKAAARALVLQSRATGALGKYPPAIEYARKSWEAYPTSEAARTWANWLARSGDPAAAVAHYADAFTIEDPRSTEVDRAHDRMRMGELYVKVNGSEKGLGDLILTAYDRSSALMSDHIARLKTKDPNAQASKILDFTLPAVTGPDLALSSLKGKTIVMDFWATWCVPCRTQRPLYEAVEKDFKDDPRVVFLSLNTDEDRSLVVPFLKKMNWTHQVYFDGGLSEYVKVGSIPMTLVIDPEGRVSSRMNGFIPERFMGQLTDRIRETLR